MRTAIAYFQTAAGDKYPTVEKIESSDAEAINRFTTRCLASPCCLFISGYVDGRFVNYDFGPAAIAMSHEASIKMEPSEIMSAVDFAKEFDLVRFQRVWAEYNATDEIAKPEDISYLAECYRMFLVMRAHIKGSSTEIEETMNGLIRAAQNSKAG